MKNQKGFTLIEILVALFLVVIVIGLVVGNPFSSRQNLESALFELERTLRYARDEATLRNSIVRLRIDLEYPQNFILEYGPNDNFVLPADLFGRDQVVTSLAEEEYYQELQDEVDRKFHRVSAFLERPKEFPINVEVIGGSTNMTNRLITEHHFSVYIYPSGEMDQGVIFLASDDEIALLAFEAFLDDFHVEYFLIDDYAHTVNLEQRKFEAAERIYRDWTR